VSDPRVGDPKSTRLLDLPSRPLSRSPARACSPSTLVWTEAPEPRPGPVLLTIAEVAAALRISEKSVQRRIKDGIIRKAQLGGRSVRISSEELQRLIAGTPPEEAP
jgi:excisionase family DNA binding protein